MFMSQHIAMVDMEEINKMKDGKNKSYILDFVEKNKNGRFRPSLNQIKWMDKNLPKIKTDVHQEQADQIVNKLHNPKPNTDNWISMCGFMNNFIASRKVELDPTSISKALTVIKLGINQFKDTELN